MREWENKRLGIGGGETVGWGTTGRVEKEEGEEGKGCVFFVKGI